MPFNKNLTDLTFFSYGFRPFFFSATVFALLVVPLWWVVWQGKVALAGPFTPTDWHIHEMIFGYAAAVLAGFLFTAVPNWTGRLPTKGWPLLALLGVWSAGRIASAGLAGLPPMAVAVVDQLFLLCVVAMIAREIIAAKKWRNLIVVLPVTLLWITNLCFHAEAMTQGTTDISRRLGIAVLIFLVMLIGGRVVPNFTRNWLVREKATKLPVPFNRFDAAAIGISVIALLVWVIAPFSIICAALALLAGGLQTIRLFRWRGWSVVQSPLLVMLHIAYAMIPIGLTGIMASAMGWASPAVGVHLLGIGAVGSMTVAVMIRATMGHIGRDLRAGHLLTCAFTLLILAALFRAIDGAIVVAGFDGTDLSALLWSVAFALVVIRIGPWLIGPRVP
jgi:uncharacterized protein involved in response to NO